MRKLGVGCYGTSGHQVLSQLVSHPRAELVAAAGVPADRIRDLFGERAGEVTLYPDLDSLLSDKRVELVSLCSPVRFDQPAEVLAVLESGRHALAEKPAAFSPADLENLVAAAGRRGVHFREMGGVELTPPLPEIREMVTAGLLGEIVQAWAMKSYPYHDRRSQDPRRDGGIMQAGVHAVRFICATAGLRVRKAAGFVTGKANPVSGGGLQMAASVALEFDTGAVGGIVINYLNPAGLGAWGNDQLRLHGFRAMAETTDGFTRGCLVDAEGAKPLATIGRKADRTYFDYYADFLLDGTPMPTPFEKEVGFMEDSIKIMEALYLPL